MKTIDAFLSYLRSLEVKLWIEGNRLHYSAPKGTLTAALRAELAERKAEIQKFLHKANLGSHSTLELIPSVPRDGDLPLSFAQQRLWFLDQLESQSTIYNMPAAVRLIGHLDLAGLEMAVQEIVQRHEVLRTTFEIVNGAPTQVIAPTLKMSLSVVDLQALPVVAQSVEVQRLALEEAQSPFDLRNGPLLRVTLLRLVAEEHVLLVTMHHIVSDGWSMGIFIREFATLYEAFSMGGASPLPQLPIQYADFAHWQRQWLSGEVLENHLTYWKQQLTGAPPLLELPTDRTRPPMPTYWGTHYSFVLPKTLTERLNGLSQREGGTLFMTLLAAFVTLLSRYSDQEDIVVGSPIANRNRREIESLIGFFVNTLVLRTNLKGNPSFLELLQRVRQVALDAYAHQNLPFEQLVDALQPERNLSHSPLFQVMFVLQNAPMGKLELPGLTLTPMAMEIVTAKFDLTLSMTETDQGLRGTLEYNSDLFDRTTMTKMAKHFQTLLEAIVANPQQRISELPLLSEAERHQLLVEWNDTQAKYPQDQCIHQLFEAQAEQTPEAVAVVFEDSLLTYQELNARANQLAHHLQFLGVGPEVLVGICTERSLEMVVGLLGILKAGGAYVPLDPAYPQERLAFMMSDAQVPVLLTQERLVENLPEHWARVVCLDSDWGTISQESQDNPVSGIEPESLAYVIYTSGSTGKPKGVLVSHYNVARLLAATQSWFDFDERDVWTLFHSYAFDFSVWELWGALLYGGQLVVVPYWVSRAPEAFYDLLCMRQVTVLNQTPSAFRQLIRTEEASGTSKELSLRLVIFGGEALELQSLKPWFERHGDQSPQLVNMYGITETTVHVTYRPLTIADLNSTGSVIGSPIPDLQVYILDRHQQPVPIGVLGEMCIGGAGLTQGYLNRPELTAEKFIASPFSNQPEARLYKSGDLARYLPNGDIEYLGRLDHQVKIRGFRIELGEIEAVLSQHPDVRENVVLVRENHPGDKRVVAYVIPHREPSTTSELRHFLKAQLPDYMVPSAFVMLDALPLTPNGKVDRRALPIPDKIRPKLESGFVAPCTPTEETLVDIWTEVLGLKQVGIRDNFFDLGGNSLLIIQVHSKIGEIFNNNVLLVDLFRYPTIGALAQYLSQEHDLEPLVTFRQIHDRTRRQKEAIKRQKQLMQQRRTANG